MHQIASIIQIFLGEHALEPFVLFIHNTGLTEEKSLIRLLDAISSQEENDADVIEHSKYYDDRF